MSERPQCKLHPDVPKYKLDEENKKEERARCEECEPWQRYILYAIPALLYLPWAIGKLRCPPKCCPPAYICCPPPPQPCPPPRQGTCAEHNPAIGKINPMPPKQPCQTQPRKPLKNPKDNRCLPEKTQKNKSR